MHTLDSYLYVILLIGTISLVERSNIICWGISNTESEAKCVDKTMVDPRGMARDSTLDGTVFATHLPLDSHQKIACWYWRVRPMCLLMVRFRDCCSRSGTLTVTCGLLALLVSPPSFARWRCRCCCCWHLLLLHLVVCVVLKERVSLLLLVSFFSFLSFIDLHERI